MTQVDVVGGVYGERCHFPERDEVFGSAGRAAVALSAHVEKTILHTVLPADRSGRITPNFESFGIDVRVHSGAQLIGFDYLHCLADPKISPHPSSIVQQPPFDVEASVAAVFGMMECVPRVKANTCVYDPQSPNNPKGFRASGGKCDRLAIVANAQEIAKLAGTVGDKAAQLVLKQEGAELVVVKSGLKGALVYDEGGLVGKVPAFKTDNVYTIGSGDVFVAAFALAWGIRGMQPLEAARYASKAVAAYVETSALPMLSPDDVTTSEREVAEVKSGLVYLAGPFRELGQRIMIDEARSILERIGMKVFSPVHDIGRGPAEVVVPQDLNALKECDAVFAILNGSSPGTLFEVGYAVRGGTQVFCVAQNMRDVDTKLPRGSGCIVHPDFVSALHLLAWRE